jgi:hypothetical protein
MSGKAGKTTTGWRRRYLVQVWDRSKHFEVLLVRGSAKRVRKGVQRVLIYTDKWEWYEIDSEPYVYSVGRRFFDTVGRRFFDTSERGELLALAASLRMRGFSLIKEIPTW